MPDEQSSIKLTVGLGPDSLVTSLSGDQTLVLSNQSPNRYHQIKVNVTYYDQGDQLIDFESLEIESLEGLAKRTHDLSLDPPAGTTYAVVDTEGIEQTLLRRHWGKLSTAVILIWGLIVLSRRLAPDL